ncbi:MAG: uracil-DNA glycosylase [Acidobacteriota bacterium]|nr:uracil-DNA glycosylase [Acidobacteriota bacterium]
MSRVDLSELPTCARCALAATRQRVVVGSGPTNARLVVVGEAPGRFEDEGGQPFVGRSGQLLVRVIEEELGLGREAYFITNTVKCRPPQNRPPRRDEIATCRPWLDEQLRVAAGAVVLAVGNVAGRAVFGYTGPLAHARGRLLSSARARGVVTYHPAAALRGGSSVVAMMREDLRVLRPLVVGA